LGTVKTRQQLFLLGSSENGPADGLAMAESVKTYLPYSLLMDQE
jgi:hypothetical protein